MQQLSKAIFSVMIALCIGSSMGATVLNMWEQCGGTSCPSGTCQDAEWKDSKCAAGLKCFRQSEYYHQCRATAQVYQQCGGASCQFKGLCSDNIWAACAEGSCVRKSEWYWQCLPANQAKVQSTASPAASQKNMRLSKAQLAHVPIPRHSVVLHSKKPAADASASIASVAPAKATKIAPEALPEQVRPAAAASVASAAVKPAKTVPAKTENKPAATPVAIAAVDKKPEPENKDAAVSIASIPAKTESVPAKPAAVGMPYSTEPTKPAIDASVAIASAKPSESKPAAVGMPYSTEPTKPATAAEVSIASAKPADAKPAAVGMPYSTEPTKPGVSDKATAAAAADAAVSTAAVSKSDRSGTSSSSSRSADRRSDAHSSALQWERPALSTASVDGPRPSGRPQHVRPRKADPMPWGPARAMDFEQEENDEAEHVAAAALRPAARSMPAGRYEPMRMDARVARDAPRGPPGMIYRRP